MLPEHKEAVKQSSLEIIDSFYQTDSVHQVANEDDTKPKWPTLKENVVDEQEFDSTNRQTRDEDDAKPTPLSAITVQASSHHNKTKTKQSPPEFERLTGTSMNLFREVSIIGLRFVLQPSSSMCRRLVWIAVILAGTCFTIYQIQDRISFYFSWPTNVGIRVEHVDSIRFPTVTICNENRAIKSMTDKYNATYTLGKLFSKFPDPSFFPSPINATYYNTDDIKFSWYLIYLIYSQPPSTAILSAYFNGKNLIRDLPPSTVSLDEMAKNEDWLMEHYQLKSTPTDVGFCYTFNSKLSNYTSDQPGGPAVLLGLQMILDVQQDEYLFASSLSAGFRVMVYDQGEYPWMKQYGFRISPGFATQVAVNTEYHSNLPSPYGVCNSTLNYKQSQCLAYCLSDYVIKLCKCRDIYMPGSAPVCGPNQLGQCVFPAQNTFVLDNMASKCNCALQCDTLIYKSEITQSTLSDAAMRSLSADYALNLTLDEIRRNVAVLEVFFSDLTITYIETTAAYTSLALLCDIGGALGLILGSTLLTFCEIADATLMALLTYPIRRRHTVDRVSPIS